MRRPPRPHIRTTHRTLGNGYTSSRSYLVPALHAGRRAEEASDRTRTPQPRRIGKEIRPNANRPHQADAPQRRY